jgi:hypothetical protein
MSNENLIENRVAKSGLIMLNLEEYFPRAEEILAVDLKDFLFKELILREAEFREMVKQKNWQQYENSYVAVYSSANAIIPMWAYMIIAAALAPFAKDVACSHPFHAAEIFLYRNIAKLNAEDFRGQRIVIKGCGERQIPEAAFVQVTQQLSKVVRSIMYGEPCSTVPVFKKTNE